MAHFFTHSSGKARSLTVQNTPNWSTSLLAGITMLGALFVSQTAKTQEMPGIYAPGDIVVTGFSGIKPQEGGGEGNPLDGFFIDTQGASMKIFKGGSPGDPQGQLLNVPSNFTVPASEIGQVFAVALEDHDGDGTTPPNIYLGATSIYGLNIVVPGANGAPKRSATGAPGAMWMDGQFATTKGGMPGSIYRVDGTTGQVSLFATVAGNSGPGIGDIVYDPATRQFFASDLDTGLIHRIGSDGNTVDSFDHGTMGRPMAEMPPIPDDGKIADINTPAFSSEQPETWGFTPRDRMVWGMTLQGGRLYYAVQGQAEIWSVGISLDGGFSNDARLEFKVEGLSGDTYISDMLFDAKGRLHLAQRGEFRGSYDYSVFAEPQKSDVLRYERDPQTGQWAPVPQSYAIGFPEGHKNASGGIATDLCGTRLLTTGDNLRNNPTYADQLLPGGALDVHGLQINDIELVRPQNEPPFKSLFIDYDGQFGDAAKAGHVGDVEVWLSCERQGASGGSGYGYGSGYYTPPYGELPPDYVPPVFDTFNLKLIKRARDCHRSRRGWECNFVIRVINTGPRPYFGPITVHDMLPGLPPGANVEFKFQPPWNCVALAPNEYRCTRAPVFLGIGWGVDLLVQVQLPGRPRHCHVPNVASLQWPLGSGDANPADDKDSATAHIPEEICHQTPPDEQPHCPPGFWWNGERCERGVTPPDRHCPPGTHGDFPRCIPDEQPQCPPRQHMTRGHCCPIGLEWNGRRCTDRERPECPPGQHMTRGHCCPVGVRWTGHQCGRPEIQTCPTGTVGRFPHCRPVIIDKCPKGMIGRPPHCRRVVIDRCPSGTIGRFPHCRPVIIDRCPKGMIGRPPHCRRVVIDHCPRGTVRRHGHCVSIDIRPLDRLDRRPGDRGHFRPFGGFGRERGSQNMRHFR